MLTKAKKIKAIIVTVLATIALSIAILSFLYAQMLNHLPPLTDAFTITAHTGCENTNKNSLQSIIIGCENGADAVEFDLRFLDDGTPVLAHETEEKSAECVTLTDAFDLLKNYDCKINIDVKETTYLNTVRDLIYEYNYQTRCYYTGIHIEQVAFVKEQSPDIAFYLNIDSSYSQKHNEPLTIEYGNLAISCGAIGINIKHTFITKENVVVWHNMGLLVSVYTVNGSLKIAKMLNCNVDNITTLKPSKVINTINNN